MLPISFISKTKGHKLLGEYVLLYLLAYMYLPTPPHKQDLKLYLFINCYEFLVCNKEFGIRYSKQLTYCKNQPTIKKFHFQHLCIVLRQMFYFPNPAICLTHFLKQSLTGLNS